MFNISHFTDTLPSGFGNWTLQNRWEYFDANLDGFGYLDQTTQWRIASHMTPDDLNNAYNNYVEEIGADATWSTFLQNLAQYTEDLLTTTATMTTASLCASVEDNEKMFIIINIPFALLLIFCLSFLEKRNHLFQNCCKGRPGLVIAIDFVHADKRLWAIGAVFGLLSYGILDLFGGTLIVDSPAYADPNFSANFGWTRVFLIMLNVVILGTVYYPLLACVTLRRHLAANILGLIYLTPWLMMRLFLTSSCPLTQSEGSGGANDPFPFEGVVNLLFHIPLYVCYILLYIAYIMDLVKNSRRICCGYKKKSITTHKSYLYVKGLLEPPMVERPTNLKGKIIKKVKYNNITGFRYSPRVICAVICSGFALYKTATMWDIVCHLLAQLAHALLPPVINLYLDQMGENDTYIYDRTVEGINIITIELRICNYLAALMHILFLIDILRVYRHNTRKMYRGDHSWHHPYELPPGACMFQGIRYGGYQVAYMIYGWAFMCAILFLILAFLTFSIILPLRDGYKTSVLNMIIHGWPAMLLGFLIHKAQVLLCNRLFLQEKGKYLAINNRRLFSILDFFFFFYNVVIGIFSCLKRVLLSVIFGTLLISRLDKCLLLRGFERFDPGIQSYLGMMKLEVQNSHPVMVVFIKLLEEASKDQHGKERTPEMAKSRKYRNKWYRAYTLARNPSIVLDRLQKELKDTLKANKTNAVEFVDTAVSMVAALGTVAIVDGLHDSTESFV